MGKPPCRTLLFIWEMESFQSLPSLGHPTYHSKKFSRLFLATCSAVINMGYKFRQGSMIWLFLTMLVGIFGLPIQYSIVPPTAAPLVITAVEGASSSAGVVIGSYGYDLMDQSIVPLSPYFTMVAFRRQYGFRSGWLYGYGIFYEAPPFFGFGEVRLGLGINPWADNLAAWTLNEIRLRSLYNPGLTPALVG